MDKMWRKGRLSIVQQLDNHSKEFTLQGLRLYSTFQQKEKVMYWKVKEHIKVVITEKPL